MNQLIEGTSIMKMEMKKNPLTGDWLCWIEGTSQAYYYKGKRSAEKFVRNVNKGIENGEILIDDKGNVTKKEGLE